MFPLQDFGDLIYYYYYYDMDYVVVSSWERACVSVITVVGYFHVTMRVREFIIAIDKGCMSLL